MKKNISGEALRTAVDMVRSCLEKAARALAEIRRCKPLVHNITNFVVMNDTANILLHIGASPVMAHAAEEAEEMAGASKALVLNIGTLDRQWVESMLLAGRAAAARGVPVVFDPVGAGATQYRTEVSLRILEEVRPQVLRGNAAEVSVLAGMEAEVLGVDAGRTSAVNWEIAQEAARRFGTTAVVTGPQDAVCDGSRLFLVNNGHSMLGGLTGTGCMVTALTGAFLAVEEDAAAAALGALVSFGIAAEKAAQKAHTPASFKTALFDEVYLLTPEALLSGARVEAVPL